MTREANHINTEEEMMTQVYRCVVVLACLIVTVGVCSMNGVVLAAGGDAGKGKAIFQAKCVTCHGPKGKGDGPLAKALKPPPANFASAVSKKKPEAELLQVIESGKPKTAMVAWKGQLSDAEIQDVLAYVLTLRK